MMNKSNIGMKKRGALRINENDAPLDCDSTILLSHELIHHWLVGYKTRFK